MPIHSSNLNSVQKACRILKALTDPKIRRLTDIANVTGLNKVTTLRLLEILTLEGLIHRDEPTKTYSFGDEAFIVAVALRRRRDLRDAARPSLLRLAALSEDNVLLSVQSGTESVCIERETGSFHIRANYLEVGSRRPLGVGAGSLALLAWLPDPEIETILADIQPRLKEYPSFSVAGLRAEVGRARERGYALMLNVVHEGIGAIGMPIMGTDGRPIASISVAALSERIASREARLAAALAEEAKLIAGVMTACSSHGTKA